MVIERCVCSGDREACSGDKRCVMVVATFDDMDKCAN